MQKIIFAAVVVSAACALSQTGFAADDVLSACYREADTNIKVQDCLKRELASVQKDYEDIVDRVLNNARELDRVQRKKTAVKAFEDANKAFKNYVEQECNWVEASFGSGTGAGNAELACRINLIVTRTSALDSQFLSGRE